MNHHWSRPFKIPEYFPAKCQPFYSDLDVLTPCGPSCHMASVIPVNSLAPGRPGCHFKTVIFNLVLLIGIFTSSKDNPLRWMPWDLIDDQVMALCHQATSHYLSQCWPSSMSLYGITRPQWVNIGSCNGLPSVWCQVITLNLCWLVTSNGIKFESTFLIFL